jgi:hypothetical protein
MLDILTAHVSHETGNGERMFNYNFGGIKGPSERGLVARYGTTEFFNGHKTSIRAGFRAYRSLDEGAVDYVKFMRAGYGKAVSQAESGDVDGFSAALKSRGYYTAPQDAYAAAMRAHVRQGAHGAASSKQAEPGFQVRKGGGFLYGHELASESLALDGGTAMLPTAVEVARVIDSVSALSSRIAAPLEDEEDDAHEA